MDERSVAPPIRQSTGRSWAGAVPAAVAAAAVGCVWAVGGSGGILYAVFYLLAVLPGLPLGFLFFGVRHPAGWIAGALLGYAGTALVLWIPIAAGTPSRIAFVAAWLGFAAITWTTWWRVREASIAPPRWTRADSAGLSVILALTLALSTPPLSRVGTHDPAGNQLYRAYFTADFLWHTALTSELSKFVMPPRNPYLASQSIHYYWAYFLPPAVISRAGPSNLHDAQTLLKVNALLTGLLLMSAVFLAAWAAFPRAGPVTIAVALTLVAASAEGTYEIWDIWHRGRPLSGLSDVNIDAITAWHFLGLRLDGLPRCLWYVPQHSLAYALGLLALAAAAIAGSSGSLSAILLCGTALAAATAINPFVGGIFALTWGTTIAVSVWREANPVRRLLLHSLAALPVAGALAWCVAAHMVDGAAGVLEIGFFGPPRHAPVVSLMLSLGPVLVPAAAGLLVRRTVAFARVLPAVALVTLSLLLMYLVRLRVDQAWVPFRAGQMLLVAIPALVAQAVSAFWDRRSSRRLGVAAIMCLMLIGAPTTIIDAYNAQDVRNTRLGPGFHWNLVLHPDEAAALEWIRANTPTHAIVQMEPTVRDRVLSGGSWGERWSLVPSFAERRMAAGLPISLMNAPEYSEKSASVRTMYQSLNAHEAWTIARRLHIVYIYVDRTDREAYEGAVKFDRAPQFFTRVFTQGEASVFIVR